MLDHQRFVSVDGGEAIRPAPGASLFDASTAGQSGAAAQHSSFAASGLGGDGSTSAVAGAIQAESVLSLRFTVDAVSAFALSGTISAVPGASAFLADSNGIFHVLDGDLALAGVFQPGTQYTLFVGISDDVGSFSVDLTVPEPTLLLLVALALAALTLRCAAE